MALTLCSFKITSHYFLYIAKYTMLYTVTVCWVFVVCLKLDWWQLIVEMFLSIVSRHCEVYYKKSTCTVFYTRIQGLTNLWQMLPRGTLQLLLLLQKPDLQIICADITIINKRYSLVAVVFYCFIIFVHLHLSHVVHRKCCHLFFSFDKSK